MIPLSDEELEAIADRVGAATPGPWAWHHPTYGRDHDLYSQSARVNRMGTDNPEDEEPVGIIITDSGFYPPEDNDRPFLAHVREDVVALLDTVVYYRRRLAELAPQDWDHGRSLPSPADLYGSDPDFTSGVESTEYLHQMRARRSGETP